MPILPPEYIATWYYFSDGAGLIRLFEDWSEKESQQADPTALIQGDIGTHVINVGGIKWITRIKSPALIVELDPNTSDTTTDAFDLIKYSFNLLRNPLTQANENYLLKSANINIAQEGVTCDIEFWSSVPGAFQTNYAVNVLPPDFIARVARFYDTYLTIYDPQETQNYAIVSGTISINVDISENFFVNTGSQAPYFGIQGYTVTGSVTVVAAPSQFSDLAITRQQPGQLIATKAATSLQIGNTYLGLGQSQIRREVEKTMRPNEITKAKIDFVTYTRFTTPIG
jgi:hypothetical protein